MMLLVAEMMTAWVVTRTTGEREDMIEGMNEGAPAQVGRGNGEGRGRRE